MTCPDCPTGDDRQFTASGLAVHRRYKHASATHLLPLRLSFATVRRLRSRAAAARVSPAQWCEQVIARAVAL